MTEESNKNMGEIKVDFNSMLRKRMLIRETNPYFVTGTVYIEVRAAVDARLWY